MLISQVRPANRMTQYDISLQDPIAITESFSNLSAAGMLRLSVQFNAKVLVAREAGSGIVGVLGIDAHVYVLNEHQAAGYQLRAQFHRLFEFPLTVIE